MIQMLLLRECHICWDDMKCLLLPKNCDMQRFGVKCNIHAEKHIYKFFVFWKLKIWFIFSFCWIWSHQFDPSNCNVLIWKCLWTGKKKDAISKSGSGSLAILIILRCHSVMNLQFIYIFCLQISTTILFEYIKYSW